MNKDQGIIMPLSTSAPAIHIQNLSARYGAHYLFQNLNLNIAAGKITILLGASGIGKTTLLRLIAGLEQPESGTILNSNGQTITHQLAYMGQRDLLFPWLDVLGNVTLGARLRREAKDKARAEHLLEQVGLIEARHKLPATLSGGMRQRAALARTLYEQRPIVLMDEPFSALDALTRAQLQELTVSLLQDKTVFMITHDPLEAARLGHHLVVMTGSPARLHPTLDLPDQPPRALENPDVIKTAAHLLHLLRDDDHEC